MKKYLIRVAKYIAYYYLLFLLIYAAMNFFNLIPPSTSHLFSARLAIGLALLGLFYPLMGFKRITIDLPQGGREQHGQKVCEVIEACDYKVEKSEENLITFVAKNKIRRILNMYEDRITLEFPTPTTITMSGLRRDVARIHLRINDYLRYAK